jgi:uncharacterized membrane protein YuzA (DUF378 family)
MSAVEIDQLSAVLGSIPFMRIAYICMGMIQLYIFSMYIFLIGLENRD